MKFLFFLFVAFFSCIALTEELTSDKDAQKLAEDVMKLVYKGESLKGLELFRPYLIIPESEFNVMLESLNRQQPLINERFGKTIGIELISEQRVGESLMKITYAQKFEKHVMRWLFYFYKPRNGWVLNTFSTDDKIQYLFNE